MQNINAGYDIGRSIAKNWGNWLIALVALPVLFHVFFGIPIRRPPIDNLPRSVTQPIATPAIVKSWGQSCAENLPNSVQDATGAIQRKDPKTAFDILDMCREHLTPAAELIYKKSMTDLAKVTAEQEKKSAIDAKKQAAFELAAKKREGVSIGMTAADAVASSWGKPRKINRTTRANSVREQWVYDGGYLYFDNGVLTSIQN